jgi:hypothetical protein
MNDAVKRLLKLANLDVGMNSRGMFCVSYHDCYIKEGATLLGERGRGNTFEEACEDYMRKISGEKLVFKPFSEYRREVTVL